jgi:hypothetical protein
MKLIGFNLTKMNLEKKSDNFKGMKINSGIDILEIKEVNSPIFNSQDKILLIRFNQYVNYDQDIANLSFYGNLIISTGQGQVKEILNKWEDKKLPEDFKLIIFNLIFKKITLKALQMEEELNLPPHIPFPSFKQSEKKK